MSESPRLRLHRLLREFRARTLNTERFCAQFDHTYNTELDKSTLSPAEAAAFAVLADKVGWFSPFPEQRADVPNYLGEKDIAHAADVAVKAIGEPPAG